jgi:hypothetical protein
MSETDKTLMKTRMPDIENFMMWAEMSDAFQTAFYNFYTAFYN